MKKDVSDKAFAAFLNKLPQPSSSSIEPREHDDPLVHELIVACLSWNAPRAGVAGTLEKLNASLVDHNELRVTLPAEAAAIGGVRDALAEERFARMRAALTEIFLRENGLSLAHLRDENKRDAKAYLESLPGLPAYAAHRVALVGCGVHVFPVDPIILSIFDDAGVLDEDADESQLAARCERTLRAGEALERFHAIEAAAMTPPSRSSKKPTTKKTAAKKPTAKKAASKKTAKASKKTTKKSAASGAKKTSKKTGKKSSKKTA